MATFSSCSSSSSFLLSPNFLQESVKPFKIHLPKVSFQTLKPQICPLKSTHRRFNAVAEDTSVVTADPSSVAARRLYVGNIPRTFSNEELQKIVEEHGAVEKAEVMYDKYSGRSRRFAFVTMKTVEDAAAAAEKLNGTEVGGREIKVNVTEKPLATLDVSIPQSEESEFVDSPYKVYVGNLAKTVTTDSLKSFFAEKGKVVSAKVSRVPGTSKSSGYGFVSFSSEEDVEAAISSLNNAMGRAKLRMELISKEKSRNTTFKKRKEGLIRKLHEFTTLCDVSACMIIYGPKQEKVPSEPEIWPQNMEEINRVIALYKAKNKDSGNKTYCLSDFFHDRRRKIEEELAKLRKKNMESKYPTWLDLLNFMNEAQLRDFAGSLAHKAQYVRSRIEFLRRSKEALGLNLSNFYEQGGGSSSVNHPLHYPVIDHHYQDLHSVNQNNNSMMMLLMDNNDQIVQFGGASNAQSTASFKRQVFYESMVSGCGVVDYPVMFPGPAQYYVPPPLPLPPVPVGVMAQRQMQVCIRENHEGGQEDVVQYEMMNQKEKGKC